MSLCFDDIEPPKRTKLGEKLLKIRQTRNELLGDMADTLGVGVAELSSIELGKKHPDPDFMIRLCDRYPGWSKS